MFLSSQHNGQSRPYPSGKALLVAFAGFTATAVLGYTVFVTSGLGVGLLGKYQFLAEIYAGSFVFFARANILISFIILIVMLQRFAGYRWMMPFGLVALISFAAEFAGTTTGFPFGGYEYTGLLGAKILGHVPWLIPLSWFTCAIPAYILAHRAYPDRRVPRIGIAVFLLVLWDVTLDPAMSFLTSYWVWDTPGPYYGMPNLNFFGWAIAGLAIMVALDFSVMRDWAGDMPDRWMTGYYLLLLALPAGMCAAAGLLWPCLITVIGLSIPPALSRLSSSLRFAPDQHAMRVDRFPVEASK